jgi:hypothetical protein
MQHLEPSISNFPPHHMLVPIEAGHHDDAPARDARVTALSRISNSKSAKQGRNRNVSLRPQENSKCKLYYAMSKSSTIFSPGNSTGGYCSSGTKSNQNVSSKLIHSRQDLKSVIIFLWDNPNAAICSQRGCGLVRTQNFVNRHSRERQSTNTFADNAREITLFPVSFLL